MSARDILKTLNAKLDNPVEKPTMQKIMQSGGDPEQIITNFHQYLDGLRDDLKNLVKICAPEGKTCDSGEKQELADTLLRLLRSFSEAQM